MLIYTSQWLLIFEYFFNELFISFGVNVQITFIETFFGKFFSEGVEVIVVVFNPNSFSQKAVIDYSNNIFYPQLLFS